MLLTWQKPKTKITDTVTESPPRKRPTSIFMRVSRCFFPIGIGHVSERIVGYGLPLLQR